MDVQGEPFRGKFSTTSEPRPLLLCRCLRPGVGSSSGHSGSFRHLVSGSKEAAYIRQGVICHSLWPEAFAKAKANRTVVVHSDNTMTLSYIKNQGGTHSFNLCQTVKELQIWADQTYHQIHPRKDERLGRWIKLTGSGPSDRVDPVL